MFTREDYIASVAHESNVIKHLYTKVEKKDLDYRPTEKQRSMQELLEFLPCNLAVMAKHVISQDWSTSKDTFGAVKESARADFAGTMDRETRACIEIIRSIPEADMQGKEITLPNGVKMKLGPALVAFNFKFLTAYRMQLFLYLKSCGHAELGTPNCWMGLDAMPKK